MFHHLLIWRLILVLCVARVARLQSTLNAESSDYDQRSNFLLELKELVDQLGSEMRHTSLENGRQQCVTVDTNHLMEFRRQHEEMKTELQQIKDLLQQLTSQQLKQTVDNGSIDLTQRPLAMCEDLVAEFRRQNDDMKTELQHVKDLLQFRTPQPKQNADNVGIELTKIPLVIDGLTHEDDGNDVNVVTPASSTVVVTTTALVTSTTSPAGTTTTPVAATTPATTTTILATTTMGTTPGTPILVHTSHGTEGVLAIATLGDWLFVSQDGGSQVSVYDTTSFELQHQLTFSGLGSSIQGLAACSTYNYLYISDFWTSCIHRVGISSAGAMISTPIKWDVNRRPRALSVNSDCNVLVVCDSRLYRLVREYTPTGSLVREISDSNRLFQAVDLSNGMWAVSRLGPIHGVIVVSFNGSTSRVEHSCGNGAGSGTGRMHDPRGLTVDEHGYIIVAETVNHRLLVLNPTLTDVRQLPLPLGTKLRYPRTLMLDQSRGRLYVGENEVIGVSNSRWLVFNDVTNVGALFNK